MITFHKIHTFEKTIPMKIEHTSEIKSTRFFTTLSPKDKFPENMELNL